MKQSDEHVSVRLDVETIARLDALAAKVAPRGSKPTRSTALRAAILTGLDALERETVSPAPARARK